MNEPVLRNGSWFVGEVGPFETHAAAWRYYDMNTPEELEAEDRRRRIDKAFGE